MRSSTAAPGGLGAIRTTVASLAPDVPIVGLQTMEEHLWMEARLHRMIAVLSVAFAALATVLATVGLYAVVTYVVAPVA